MSGSRTEKINHNCGAVDPDYMDRIGRSMVDLSDDDLGKELALRDVLEQLKNKDARKAIRLAALRIVLPDAKSPLYQQIVAQRISDFESENTPEKIQERLDRIKSQAEKRRQAKEQRSWEEKRKAQAVKHRFGKNNKARKALARHPDGLFCLYCEVRLTIETYTVDHVIPMSRGGLNRAGNKVPCCFRCNNAKGDKLTWFPGCNKNGEMIDDSPGTRLAKTILSPRLA